MRFAPARLETEQELWELVPKSPNWFAYLGSHKAILEDRIRTEAYRKAILEVVKPGDVVLDIGTGTGILALFAARAGARSVFAIEKNDIINLAKEIVEANGFGSKITLIHDDSRLVDLAGAKADVLITETIGHFGLDEQILDIVIDARKRLLVDDARIIPARLKLFIAAVEDLGFYESLNFEDACRYQLDYSPFRKAALNNIYVTAIKSKQLLSDFGILQEINLSGVASTDFSSHETLRIRRSGVLHGLAGWFEAVLSKNHRISTSPYSRMTHWQCVFLPSEKPFRVEAGDDITVGLKSKRSGINMDWCWSATIFSKKKNERYSFEQKTITYEG